MKTIQIPTTSNPFIVNINNNAYQYRAGETAEVPDEVAEAIEDALELEPKPKRYLSKFARHVEDSLDIITEEDLSGITKISAYAIYNRKNLTRVTIPSDVTTIGECAFFGCSNLETVRFGGNSKIESISANVFDWCGKLIKVYLPEVPPSLSHGNTFDHINPSCVFYCKSQSSLEAYKAAENWSTLAGTYTFVVEA